LGVLQNSWTKIFGQRKPRVLKPYERLEYVIHYEGIEKMKLLSSNGKLHAKNLANFQQIFTSMEPFSSSSESVLYKLQEMFAITICSPTRFSPDLALWYVCTLFRIHKSARKSLLQHIKSNTNAISRRTTK